MILLICGATKTVNKYRHSSHIGVLFNPRKMNSISTATPSWACDNDAYNGFDSHRFLIMLEKVNSVPGCKFVTCPDVVGNAEETLRLFTEWEPVIHKYNLPVALVGQDGLESLEIPWDKFEAYFIGGTDKWKLSEGSYQIAQEAKRRSKWVHMGRVNSLRRIRYAQIWGCDSIDGSGFSRFPEQKIPNALLLVEGEPERGLFG